MDENEKDPEITLRDYFAAKALQGLVANPTYFNCSGKTFILEKLIFERAYRMADAMLKQREKESS